jgi:hypothetical protein
MLPAAHPPLSSGGGGNPSPCAEGPAGWSTAVKQHHPPSQTASPSRGVAGRSRQAGTQLARHHAHLPASPSAGLDDRLYGDVETQQEPLTLPASPSHSFAVPSWASIVRDGGRFRDPQPPLHSAPPAAITREDFLTLYERCIESGLKARFSVCLTSGLQGVSLICSISPTLSNNSALPSKHHRRRDVAERRPQLMPRAWMRRHRQLLQTPIHNFSAITCTTDAARAHGAATRAATSGTPITLTPTHILSTPGQTHQEGG